MNTEKITKTDNSQSKTQTAQELKEKADDDGDRKYMKKDDGEGVPVNKEEGKKYEKMALEKDDGKNGLKISSDDVDDELLGKKKMKLKNISDSDSSDDEMMLDRQSMSSSYDDSEFEIGLEYADKN